MWGIFNMFNIFNKKKKNVEISFDNPNKEN